MSPHRLSSLGNAPQAPNRRRRVRAVRLSAACLGAALGLAALVASEPAGADTFPGPVTFSYTGNEQSYTGPAGVTLASCRTDPTSPRTSLWLARH